MYSVYHQTVRNAQADTLAAGSNLGCTSGSSAVPSSTPEADLLLLHGALMLCRSWLNDVPVHDRARLSLLHLEALTENLISTESTSYMAMTNVRALLCTNCRHLQAASKRCSGTSLDRCLLIKAAGVDQTSKKQPEDGGAQP